MDEKKFGRILASDEQRLSQNESKESQTQCRRGIKTRRCTLHVKTILALLVLCDFVQRVLLALAAAESLLGLGNVHL